MVSERFFFVFIESRETEIKPAGLISLKRCTQLADIPRSKHWRTAVWICFLIQDDVGLDNVIVKSF